MFSELQRSPSTPPSQDKTVQDPLTSKHVQLEEMLERQKRNKISQFNKHVLSVAYPMKTKLSTLIQEEDMESDTLLLYKDQTKVVESKHEEVVCKDNSEKHVLKENAKETQK